MMHDIMPEPESEIRGAGFEVASKLLEADQPRFGDFARVGPEQTTAWTEQDRHRLVLDEAILEPCFITGVKAERERSGEPELFAEPPLSGRDRAFSPAGMSAAAVRPQTAGMILGRMPPLQKDPPGPVHEKDREGAVSKPPLVHLPLAQRSDGSVSAVDQDQLFLLRP
jgi:hypothetical protein